MEKCRFHASILMEKCVTWSLIRWKKCDEFDLFAGKSVTNSIYSLEKV